MGAWDQVTTWLAPRLGAVVVVQAVVLALLVVAQWHMAAALGRLTRHYHRLAGGVAEGNLERLLDEQMQRLETARGEVASLTKRVDELARQADGAVQRVGLVRYDAFPDLGGQVSFAAALLNEQGDGVLFNSLFARETSTIYGKAVRGGKAAVALTEEEEQALAEALRGWRPPRG
jgi:hypothetical protein